MISVSTFVALGLASVVGAQQAGYAQCESFFSFFSPWRKEMVAIGWGLTSCKVVGKLGRVGQLVFLGLLV